MSIINPEVPAQAYREFLAQKAPAAASPRAWIPENGPLPSLYLSHGAPPVFDDAHWMDQLFGWSQSLPKPKGVLVISAHWESAPSDVVVSGTRDATRVRLRRILPRSISR